MWETHDHDMKRNEVGPARRRVDQKARPDDFEEIFDSKGQFCTRNEAILFFSFTDEHGQPRYSYDQKLTKSKKKFG